MRLNNLIIIFTLLAIGLNAFGSATENKEELEKKRLLTLSSELQERVLTYIPEQALIIASSRVCPVDISSFPLSY